RPLHRKYGGFGHYRGISTSKGERLMIRDPLWQAGTLVVALSGACLLPLAGVLPAPAQRNRGIATAEETRPKSFPHRIWAACDFEGQTPDYAWFGPADK